MPEIFTDWSSLRKKLAKTDLSTVNKRIGQDSTLVIELDPLRYDSSIPIFTDKQFRRWLKNRKPGLGANAWTKNSPPSSSSSSPPSRPSPSPSHQPVPSSSRPPTLTISSSSSSSSSSASSSASSSSASSSSSPSSQSSSPSPFRSASPPPPPSALPSRPRSASPPPPLSPALSSFPEFEESIPSPNTNSSSLSDLNKGFREAVCEGRIDSLVLNEPIDDEYTKYEDDEVETELSKNLKKIRPDQVKTKAAPAAAPAPPPPPPPPSIRQQSTVPSTEQSLDSNSNGNTSQLSEAKAPRLANWQETSKNLETNNFSIVLKDLTHFKSDIKSNEIAKSVLKDFVMKCIQFDETHYLAEVLTLVYEPANSFNEDCDFWSELVGRIKRKLNIHTTFKNKLNPMQIYQNYQRILLCFDKHARAYDITLKLPYNLTLFIGAPYTESPLSLPAVKKEKSENSINNSGVTVKTDVKPLSKIGVIPKPESSTIQQNGNSKACGIESNNSLDERRENMDPTVVRHVELVGKQNGCQVFRIATKKSAEKVCRFRKRL